MRPILFALLLASPLAAAARGTVTDPLDDTFGGFLDQPDVARIVASYDAATITVRVDFHNVIAPPDFDLGLGTVGSVELDTDHDPATGTTAFMSVCPFVRDTGFEYAVTLWGFEPDADDPRHGVAPLLDAAFDPVALADVTYEAQAVVVVIPRAGLPGDVDIAAALGTPSEPTDCAPDRDVARASPLGFGDGFE